MNKTIPLLFILFFVSFYNGRECNDASNTLAVTYRDLELQPVGCNDTTMLTVASRSKSSCAVSCLLSGTCAAFVYSRTLSACSMCSGDVIQNMTYNTGVKFSWPHQNLDTSDINQFYAGVVSLQYGINVGHVVRLTCYPFLYSPDGPLFGIRLQTQTGSEDNSLLVNVGKVYTNTYYEGVYMFTKFYTVDVNTTHVVDILVANDGYQIFIDHSHIGFIAHRLPYKPTQIVSVSGKIQAYAFSV
ncbi:hypothetical protein BgiBS90_034076 [Biomphalaria glabrata]|nr:hypothetical protein BgiBS90_034076 [Biomphalaria glabrata]